MKELNGLSSLITSKGRFQFKAKSIRSLILIVTGLALIFPALAVLPAGASPTITEYTIPTSNGHPVSIVTGSDGNLWFTEELENKIGKITPSGTVTEYTVPTSDSVPTGITSGPDGALWFTENNTNKIGRITTSGTFTEYTVPENPYEITSGPDGALWFTASNSSNHGEIGRITTSGTVTMYSLPSYPAETLGITSGPDGNLWFTAAYANVIGKITPSGTVTEYTVPTSEAFPRGITSGPDGNLWFTESGANKIGSITPSGSITEYTIPTSGGEPWDITSGPDGALWFAEGGGSGNDVIDRVTTSGVITGYDTPTSSSAPVGITSGPDGALWFTEAGANQIGRLSINEAAPVTIASLSPSSDSDGTYQGPVTVSLSATAASGFSIVDTYYTIDGGSQQTYSSPFTVSGSGTHTITYWSVDNAYATEATNTESFTISALPTLSYFTANNGSTFSRQSTPFTSGVATQTVNSDGSITVAVNDAPGYADSGFYLYDGPLSGLPDFTVNSSSGDFGLNLWFDNANLGDFFQWNGSGVMTSTDGDTYGLSSGSTDGTLAVNSDTSFYMMNDGNNYTLAQLQAGDDSAVSPSTNVAVWVGVDVGSGGSTSATISSIEGL